MRQSAVGHIVKACLAATRNGRGVRRNVEHLKIMVGKDFWQGQDMTPLQDAIAAHDA